VSVDKYYALGFLFAIEAFIFSVLAYLFYFYFQGLGRKYIKYWAISLVALALNQLVLSIQHFSIEQLTATNEQLILIFMAQLSQYLHILFLLFGFFLCDKQRDIKRGKQISYIVPLVVISLLVAMSYSANEQNVFNHFYLQKSLAEFILGCAYLAIAIHLYSRRMFHFSAKIMIIFSLVIALRYLFFSFLSILVLTEPWFHFITSMLVYFDVGAKSILGFIFLIWIHGAEQNIADRAINRAQYLGKHDALTGALNREKIIEKLPDLIHLARQGKQDLVVYLIDIKHFKYVNDTYGLKVGDLVLEEVVNRLNASLMLPQVVGRLSGDSFIFAIEMSEESQQEKAASHLHDIVARPFLVQQHEVNLQANIGYCVAPVDGNDAEVLLHKANLALNQAESNNIPSAKYVAGMQAYGKYLIEVEKEIRQGLKNHEFILYYQPQLNLLTNRIDAVEALIRWQHPERGLLEPAEFLEDFNTLGLDGELDNYVLELACKTNAAWYQQYKRRVTIAVNMSAVQFQDATIISKIQGLLYQYNMPSINLELEITENVVITDISSAMDTIVTLQNMGIKVSIDDFGTGYSSLAYLRELPIDKIKIDRSFIKDFASSDADLTIVKSMIKLSHGLGKRVLAEGVETKEQLQLLRQLGCDAVQGYFVNKPLAEEKFTDYLLQR
jgi:diguanylate cyclase (GGDEF)-like protein